MSRAEINNADNRKVLEAVVTDILESNHKMSDQIKELSLTHEKELDSIFKDLLMVIDSFEKADNRLAEQYPDNDDVNKARKRFATAKKKLVDILNKNGIEEITFPTGMASALEDCTTVDTEPDAEKPNGQILSVEKAGYRRNGRLLRSAEVVVVKN